MQSKIEAYPLCWPVGYKRTMYPERNIKFKQTSFTKVRDLVFKELDRLKATKVIMSTNIPLRQDGIPYADWERRSMPDKGVAVYFQLDSEQKVLCCDAWDRLEDNMYSIALTIEAMRGMDRWGCSDMLQRVFTGFKALAEQTHTIQDAWATLGLNGKPASMAEAKAAYEKRAMVCHPDLPGGSHNAMVNLNLAYEMAQLHFK